MIVVAGALLTVLVAFLTLHWAWSIDDQNTNPLR